MNGRHRRERGKTALSPESLGLEQFGSFVAKMVVAADGNQASVGDITFTVFQLDRGVFYMEIFGQHQFHAPQYHFNFRERNIIDQNVAGQRVRI
jgi:hypothetical protein